MKMILKPLIFATGLVLSCQAVLAETVRLQPGYQQQVQQLVTLPRVKAAMANIVQTDSRNEQDLIALTEIPAPPFGEQQRAAYFAGLLSEYGFDEINADAVGNVIALRKGNKANKTIAIAAHLDTVFPIETDVKVRRKGEKLYAPGIGDNSRGLVLLLAIARALQAAGIQTQADILFIGNVGEEGLGDLRGVKHLFAPGQPKIDSFIAIDGGNTERLIYGGIGSLRYRVIYRGPGGHSWGAFGLANPAHALGRAISLFDQHAPVVTSSGAKSSYNIGRIGGGTSVNSVPFEAWAEVDMRSGEQSKINGLNTLLKDAARQALARENQGRSRGQGLTLELKPIGNRPAGKGDPHSELVQQMIAAMQHLGVEPQLKLSSTDANIPISLGIPAITISRGGKGGRAHSLDEWWQNENGHIAIQQALLVLLAQAGLAN